MEFCDNMARFRYKSRMLVENTLFNYDKMGGQQVPWGLQSSVEGYLTIYSGNIPMPRSIDSITTKHRLIYSHFLECTR
jgi:hypothetical protein